MISRLSLLLVSGAALLCGAGDLPVALSLDGCDWSYSSGRLTVGWGQPVGTAVKVDAYELQLSATKDGEPFAVVFTEKTALELAFLNTNTEYWFRLRAHAAGAPSYGNGTWGGLGDALKCRTLGWAQQPQADAPAPQRNNASFFMSVIRVSPFFSFYHEAMRYPYVDYLGNQNSADLPGAAEFAADVAFPIKSRPQDFAQSTWTQYCVEVLNVPVPDTTTTAGDARFADFQSCGQGSDTSNPQCHCATVGDRRQGQHINKNICHLRPGGSWNQSAGVWERGYPTFLPCLGSLEAWDGCECHCSAEGLTNSGKYTGMMVTPLGERYSHPKETECSASMKVGDPLPHGVGVCTWRRHPVARIASGRALLSGLDRLTGNATSAVAVLKSAFDAAPLKDYACGAESANDVVVPPKAAFGSNTALV